MSTPIPNLVTRLKALRDRYQQSYDSRAEDRTDGTLFTMNVVEDLDALLLAEPVPGPLALSRLYAWSSSGSRAYAVSGTFAVNDQGEEALQALIASKREIRFGEIRGKHSDVRVVMTHSHLRAIPATPDAIAAVIQALEVRYKYGQPYALISGSRPFYDDSGEIDLDDPAELLWWAQGHDEPLVKS